MICRLAVVGLGLLGGSVAKAVRERGLAREVVAVGRRIESLTAEVNLVLDGVQSGFPDPFAQSPVAQEYLALTRAALELGYEPQGITLQRNSASVTAIAHWPSLEDLTFTSSGATWALAR